MAPLDEAEFARALAASPLAARLATAVDRESAREMLAARLGKSGAPVPAPAAPAPAPGKSQPAPSTGGQVAAAAAAALGGLFRFATSREGQRLIRGVLGNPTRRRSR
jgi:hypothetical protein